MQQRGPSGADTIRGPSGDGGGNAQRPSEGDTPQRRVPLGGNRGDTPHNLCLFPRWVGIRTQVEVNSFQLCVILFF